MPCPSSTLRSRMRIIPYHQGVIPLEVWDIRATRAANILAFMVEKRITCWKKIRSFVTICMGKITMDVYLDMDNTIGF